MIKKHITGIVKGALNYYFDLDHQTIYQVSLVATTLMLLCLVMCRQVAHKISEFIDTSKINIEKLAADYNINIKPF